MYYPGVMETATAREFNQNASRILAAAENGERVTVTKNGRPVAILCPVGQREVPPYPVDPMGPDEAAPVFTAAGPPVDWSGGRGEYLAGFGQ